MAGTFEIPKIRLDHSSFILGFGSLVLLVFIGVLVAAIVDAVIQRRKIEIRGATDETKEEEAAVVASGREGMDQRVSTQAFGSAVVPAVPQDPIRQAYSRLQLSRNIREAASNILETEAEIREARRKDAFLGALYSNEKDKARSSIVRKELAVFALLVGVGLIGAFGLH